ncbi:uncharacterized protein PGTG_03288 [Puccinia graminis f. sp. tritici CRL 75-36-700-3]|uniref:Beta-xylosidase C-terminal Concanavalin A-like domain-containing protein n=1 Tax=Puccinia graminis f. sp. tritici (strain CRL 75-36-700-3 / race SCCL) TaxID=418459 RepID=E3JZ57_PUCGT|nr:uncharacterized protein PGTG_03288 [Puccinia graminis f. sp. tritici CRL 75-36-700-3]EFP77332.1 hypothetical protein PGTG_03288 [Puccinia graminis f. sp. tritici CRL 75-36-700-3]
MRIILSLSFLLSLALASVAQIGLTAQYFQLDGGNQKSIKLSWQADPKVQNFTVLRKSGGTSSMIAQTQGNIYDDLGVTGGQLTYQVLVNGDPSKSSNEVTISSDAPIGSRTFSVFDNTQPSTLKAISKIKLGSTYYNYVIESDTNAMSQIIEQTSTDGYTFSGRRVLLTRKEVCAASTDGFCKLEAVTFVQNPKNSEVLMWAHWENKQDYGQARVAVAFGQPGGQWKFGDSFRPLGHDSRDLTFFQDDDGSGYLISSTNMNTDMNIYKLTADWHNVTSLVCTVLKGERREAPSLITHDKVYYLFTSKAAGWYPSAGEYISATSLAGPWSKSRGIGNLSGFGAQSGQVQKIGSSWVMCANQWSAQWLDPEPPSHQILLPISLSNGYADYHFYHQLRYLDGESQSGVYGVQSGKVLSVGQRSSATPSVAGFEEIKATNGVNLDPNNFYQPSTGSFFYTIELDVPSVLTQFDLTTRLVGGSETSYQFTISGRASPTSPFEVIVDKSNNTRVGFVTSTLSSSKMYSTVRLDVKSVLNVHNKNPANWAEGIHQFTVYGQNAMMLGQPASQRTLRSTRRRI